MLTGDCRGQCSIHCRCRCIVAFVAFVAFVAVAFPRKFCDFPSDEMYGPACP
jgi:hypothetical protein